ncbi:MAG: hypothetical protein HFH54_01555 [Lachnospiraceae bacterium]|nr:hypothetical protein [Lachnospiraceae bacterium]
MIQKEKRALWTVYPEVWEMFEEFNGITMEPCDDEAWARLVARTDQIGAGGSQELRDLLIETVADLEKIAEKRRGCG